MECVLDCKRIIIDENVFTAEGVCVCREGTKWDQSLERCTAEESEIMSINTKKTAVRMEILILVVVVAVMGILLAFWLGRRKTIKVMRSTRLNENIMTEAHEIPRTIH